MTHPKTASVSAVAVSLILLLVLPAVGLLISGQPVRPYAEFPPITQYVEPAGFSWPVFVIMAAVILAVILPFDLRVLRCRRNVSPQVFPASSLHSALRICCFPKQRSPFATKHEPHSAFSPAAGPPEPLTRILQERSGWSPTLQKIRTTACFLQWRDGLRAVRWSFAGGSDSAFRVPRSAFPWWGWAGVVLLATAWILAWTRFSWFASLQPFTFSPLWFAYIAIVNALAFRRTGHCMLKDRPRYFLSLFLVSAVFWWFFEYLNRFVQNWHYIGTGELTPLKYFIFATLPFSTVLPAVLGTYDLLASFPRASAGLTDFIRIRVARPKPMAAAVLAIFAAGLAGIGVFPNYLFPLLWVSPLAILTACQSLFGRSTIFSSLRNGDWRRIYLLAMSALICGFFWEMWNYASLAKWAYAVPFVGRFKLFEMPILGFAGYLPFGLECAVVAELVAATGAAKRADIVRSPCGVAEHLRELIRSEAL